MLHTECLNAIADQLRENRNQKVKGALMYVVHFDDGKIKEDKDDDVSGP